MRPCAIPGFSTLNKILQVFLFRIQFAMVFMLCTVVYKFYENSVVKAFMSSELGFAVRFGHCLRSLDPLELDESGPARAISLTSRCRAPCP